MSTQVFAPIHNWNEVLCRGPDTLGKEALALGKGFAESCSRQRTVGTVPHGKSYFAKSRISGSRQRICRGLAGRWQKFSPWRREVTVKLVFAESLSKLSAKNFWIFFQKTLPRVCQKSSRQRILTIFLDIFLPRVMAQLSAKASSLPSTMVMRSAKLGFCVF